MKIENLEIKFNTTLISQLQLSRLQKDYLEVLLREKTIANTVKFYFRQGWLVHFMDLYALIFNLTHGQVILNHEFIEYFKKLVIRQEVKRDHLSKADNVKEMEVQHIRTLPFFRNLKTESFDYLIQHSKTFSFPTNSLIIHEGERDRDMYVLLEGNAGIFKRNPEGDRFRVATLSSGCLFGEYGFFLNEPRLADVISLTELRVFKIIYRPEVFDHWIKKQVAENLKHRFWIIHGIMRSPILSILPEDTTDQLIHRGRVREVKAREILFREKSPGTQFYVIIQGAILIEQNKKKIKVLEQGDCFGELSLFINQGIRTASAIAEKDSLLLEINANDFFELLSENIFLAKEIEAIAYQRLKSDQKRFKSSKVG